MSNSLIEALFMHTKDILFEPHQLLFGFDFTCVSFIMSQRHLNQTDGGPSQDI